MIKSLLNRSNLELQLFHILKRMIYTKTSYFQRERVLSGGDQNGLKSPIKIIRLSTSPKNFIYSSPEKNYKVGTQPYQYKPIIQQSSNKLAYYTQSSPKVLSQQPVYSNVTIPVKTVSSSSNKPMTLRQRLWAKHKNEPIQQYNIWDGHDSQVSTNDQRASNHIKIPVSNYNSPTRSFQRKSVLKQGRVYGLENQNETIHMYEPQKRVIFYH